MFRQTALVQSSLIHVLRSRHLQSLTADCEVTSRTGQDRRGGVLAGRGKDERERGLQRAEGRRQVALVWFSCEQKKHKIKHRS